MENKKRKIMIVGSGNEYRKDKIREHAKSGAFIIACDGGYDILSSCGIKPDLLIGDLDSIKTDIKKIDVPTEKYSREKDYSDSELAIKKSVEYSAENISLFAFTGNYPDHTIYNYKLLERFSHLNVNIVLYTENTEITVIRNDTEFIGLRNRRCSFFPLCDVIGMRMDGFKYNFNKADLTTDDISLSNVIVSDEAAVSFRSGRMLVFVFDEGYE